MIWSRLIKGIRMILMVLFVILTGMGMISCSELRSEFDPHQWRYAPLDDTPPSWESDFGRPGPEYGGDMWGDTW